MSIYKEDIKTKDRKLKDRLILTILIVISWIILFIFHKYLPFEPVVYIMLAFMAGYAMLIHAADLHRRRKYKKLIEKGKFQGKNFEELNYEPFVSIIIPAHNEEKVIRATVDNILAVDYKKFEIIVIDDRSEDLTAEVLKQINEEKPEVKYFIRNKNAFPGKSAVLNDALEISQGEIICVFDADARIKPDFLQKILPYLAEPEVGAVQARKVIINRDANLLTRCQDNEYILDTSYTSGRDSIRGAVELRGNGQLVKREAVVAVGGWNNYTITDDLDLSTRLHLNGWDVRFAEDVCVYEEGITGFIPLLKQRRRWIEGSLRRYLEYFTDILTSRKISLRATIDMMAFLTEIIFPVWIISEYCIQGIRFVKGAEDNIIYTLLILPALALFFIIGLMYSIRKYMKFSLPKTIIQSIETGIYMVVIWFPMVIYIICKVIFSKKTMDWGKTEHGLHVPEAEKLVGQTD